MKELSESELDALIQLSLDDQMTEAEAEQLSTLIEESEVVRDRYWELALIHGLLEQSLHQASLKVVTGQASPVVRKPEVFSFRNPFITAAAGILLGIFCASIVWATTVPSLIRPTEEKLELFFESFESEDSLPIPRVPDQAGQWYGNFTPAVSLDDREIEPHRGKYVAEFIPHPVRKFSNAWYIIDLEELDGLDSELVPQELEVIASFASSNPNEPAHYQIRLAAFAQNPVEVRPLWNNEVALFNTVLQHVGRNEVVTASDRDWTKIRAKLEIPVGTRSLLISLAAAGRDQPDITHFMDGVRVRIKVAPGLLEPNNSQD